MNAQRSGGGPSGGGQRVERAARALLAAPLILACAGVAVWSYPRTPIGVSDGGAVLSADRVRTRIDINTATEAQLRVLPRIGPALAGRIVEHRTRHGPFETIEDLDDVRGIGPKTLEVLRPFVVVE